MDNIISIENINLKIGEKQVINNLSLEIKRGSFTSVVGNNSSGKSLLVKCILGLLKTEGKIIIDGLELNKNNFKKIISEVSVVFENPDEQFVAENVRKELSFSLENLQLSESEINNRIDSIVKLLNIEDLLDREPHTLSGGQKQLVALASALIIKPKILILDQAMTMIDLTLKEEIFKLLKKINKAEKITIINVTHDIEEVLYGSIIAVMKDGYILSSGRTKTILKNEKLFRELEIDLPFMAELSIKLKYYDLIDEMTFEMDEMVDKLWK